MRKKEDPDTAERVKLAHEIQHFFMYSVKKDSRVSEKELKYHSRMHNQVFNELVKRNFIEMKKTRSGYKYRWKAEMPRLH
ncbi:hypothetical protein JW898_04300 [Candidatus Woesearchaeota archaeon]|nr:hypothetical protein [Candidatus Woesearchaeota archaeon]